MVTQSHSNGCRLPPQRPMHGYENLRQMTPENSGWQQPMHPGDFCYYYLLFIIYYYYSLFINYYLLVIIPSHDISGDRKALPFMEGGTLTSRDDIVSFINEWMKKYHANLPHRQRSKSLRRHSNEIGSGVLPTPILNLIYMRVCTF